MLKRFTVENFKSFKHAELPLAPLTVLIGANASGKSNLLEALQILSWLAEGQRLDALLGAMDKRDLSVRGGLRDLTRETGSIRLGCIVADEKSPNLELSVSLAVTSDGLHIAEERLTVGGQKVPLYEVVTTVPHSTNLVVAYNNFAHDGKSPRIAVTDQQAVFTQLRTPARFETTGAQEAIPFANDQLYTALNDILFLDPSPEKMRGYSSRDGSKKLRGDGSNVSAVLSQVCAHAASKESLLLFVRSLPEQDIVDIKFIDAKGDVMVELVETFGGRQREVSTRLLSDGTLRVLAVAAALLSMPDGSLVVIEEVDNGVHPPRARALLDAIAKVARERDVRVLLTTHNSALLDAVPPEMIPDVVVCYRDPADGTSNLVRLDDVEDYPEIVAQGPLGHVVTKGVLDRVIKYPRTPETRQEDMNRLLDILGNR